ncbi:MAG: molybdopterin molybdotransferase MoeA [Chloroflexi bacterium]|nr:molybdopterin molybdotransferase MoeA [Chloroflexota bacterium]
MNKHQPETPLTSVSVSQALEAVLSLVSPMPAATVPFTSALGLVLAETVYSDMNIPPFDNSSMDGYALLAEDTSGATQENPARLRVIGYLPAGAAPGPADRVEAGTAFRIMTGAPIPPGANAVVPFESTNEGSVLSAPSLQPGEARAQQAIIGSNVLIYKGVAPGANIRLAGEDIRESEAVLRQGITIRPAEIGVMASVGKSRVLVHRRPRVVVLATGDELVDVNERPGPGQIRNSNSYSVAAQLTSWGAQAFNIGVARDNRADLNVKIEEALALDPDMLVTSAGVSVGDYDIVKEVLLSRGSISMWRVRVRPGKPLALGSLGEAGVPFIGLPGNPVSGMVSMELFGRPAIMKMLGKSRLQRPVITARSLETLGNSSGRASYLRAVVTKEGDDYLVRTTGDQGSGILTSMSRANAFLIMDETTRRVEAGDPVRALMLDWPEEVF